MAIIGIVAMDRQGAIGKGGALPWHYAADLKFFKEQTTGHACVMGWRTWQTLGRPLPRRLNLVLSRTANLAPQPGVVLLRDKADVLSFRPSLACDLFIIGAAQTYRAFLPQFKRWIVSALSHAGVAATTFMQMASRT